MASPLRALFVVVFVFIARIASGQPPDFTPLEAVAQEEMRDTGVPGAAIAIVSHGRVIYTKGLGVANVETGEPMTPHLLIRLGSTTKMFTAAALAALAEQGAVDLQKPVSTYVKGLHPSIGRVTAHQVLSHTSGFRDEAPMYGSHDEDALMKVVQSWSDNRFFTEPGRIYSYSNPGYWLAGAVIEAASGKLYADQLNATIFAPLGMTRTTLRPTVAITWPLAQGHDVVNGKAVVVRPFANNAASWPAGSIFSNAIDLARFVIAFMDKGRIDGKEVIAPSVIRRLTTPSVPIPGTQNQYGYGLNVGLFRGVQVVQHSGARSGYGSAIRMVPDRQFGVIVLGNRTGASLARTADRAMEIALGLPPETPETPKPLPALTEQDLARYAGTYTQPARTFEFVAKDGTLFVKDGSRETELRRIGEHRFSQNLYFVTGADGQIEYVFSGGRAFRKVHPPALRQDR